VAVGSERLSFPLEVVRVLNMGTRQGELLVDNVGDLYLCTANGTPGTWRQVALV
jgi:hypothetical protein